MLCHLHVIYYFKALSFLQIDKIQSPSLFISKNIQHVLKAHFQPDIFAPKPKHLEQDVVNNDHFQENNTISHGRIYCWFQEVFVFSGPHY